MEELIYTIKKGGSGTGYSYWKEWADCPRRAHLRETLNYDEESAPALAIGIVYHALKELWRLNTCTDVQFVFDTGDVIDADYVLEGRRLFNAYIEKFEHPSCLGTVVAVEEPVEATNEDQLGIVPFTGKLDAVVHIDEEQCERILNTRELLGYGLSPGYWLVDDKTAKARSSNLVDMYSNSHQFTGYHVLWNAKYPDKPLKGTLVDIITKTKTPNNMLISIPPPNPLQINSMKNFLKGCKAIKESKLKTWAKSDEYTCFPFGRKCPFWRSGDCNRV